MYEMNKYGKHLKLVQVEKIYISDMIVDICQIPPISMKLLLFNCLEYILYLYLRPFINTFAKHETNLAAKILSLKNQFLYCHIFLNFYIALIQKVWKYIIKQLNQKTKQGEETQHPALKSLEIKITKIAGEKEKLKYI